MRDRQHREHRIARFVRNTCVRELYITAQVKMCQHHTLRISSRAGRVIDHRQIIVVINRIIDICQFYTIRIFFCKSCVCTFEFLAETVISLNNRHVVHKDRGLQPLHLGGIDFFLYVRTYIQKHGLRVVYQGVNTLCREIR